MLNLKKKYYVNNSQLIFKPQNKIKIKEKIKDKIYLKNRKMNKKKMRNNNKN